MSGMLGSVDALMAAARARAGIDAIDTEAVEPLSVLVAALEQEGQLHHAGAQGMRERLVRILANRLRMQRDIAAHPEILDEPIVAPVVLCGMGRTGSTKTQALLGASGDFTVMPYWQSINPSLMSGDRAESPAARIAETDALAAWLDAASPDMKRGHAMETHAPEEEAFILEHSLITPLFVAWAPVPSYIAWVAQQDPTHQFRHLRTTLQYLQWQGLADRAKPWALKTALYNGRERAILDIFPDARLVMTHRHPVATIGSNLRLLETFHAPHSAARPDGARYLAGRAASMNTHLDNRATLGASAIYDIDFRDLVTDIEPVMASLYAWLGQPRSEAAVAQMRAWDTANPPGRNGRFDYNLTDYNLDVGKVELAFARYLHEMEGHI